MAVAVVDSLNFWRISAPQPRRKGSTMSDKSTGKAARKPAGGVSRRPLLQGASALAGVTAGSWALAGFRTSWAQSTKESTRPPPGPPVPAIPQIGEQATKDLGFTIKMQATESA